MTGPPRLGWLDALRGMAALVVVFDHSSYTFMPDFRQDLMPHFNTSRYGILVFFLVSGYIVPHSLEWRGCVRSFWVGRIFRMYPLWAAVVSALLALHALGIAELRDLGSHSTATVVIAHLTMLQELLGTPGVLLVLWTLSYEMSFYLLVVGLFTVRLQRRSAAFAVLLAVLAAGSVAAGVTLRPSALSAEFGTGPVIAFAAIAMGTALSCAGAENAVLRVFGGVLGGVLALVLVACNGAVPLWEGLVILAVMFLGTTVHRAEAGQCSRVFAVGTAVVVSVCAVGSAYWWGDGDHFTRGGWITAFILALITFCAGMAVRNRCLPRALTGLGTISYSVYLLHPVLLTVIDSTVGRRGHDTPVLEVAFFVVLLPVCLLTHRWIEAPSQEWGRGLARRLTRRTPVAEDDVRTP
ncbi:acyltransferase family protein [Streptomyces griseorubiginosus]|uniref:acyltransferase family protein n=1 Tax=Streptomyces griseorubiginosus TaxID=67304 RepID=UPI0036780493